MRRSRLCASRWATGSPGVPRSPPVARRDPRLDSLRVVPSQVSRICHALDDRVEAFFRNRPDACIERVRELASGMVRQKGLLVAYGCRRPAAGVTAVHSSA